MKAQEMFNLAREKYEKAFNNVKAMANDVASVLVKAGKDFDPEITTGKFDIVLQYSLLQIAVADYDFSNNEMIFIRDLTNQGDFVNYINALYNVNVTWDGLMNSTASDIKKVLATLESKMEDAANEFVTVFALCDIATPDYDYYSDFHEQIIDIAYLLAGIDGSVDKCEEDVPCLIVSALNEIKNRKDNSNK